MKGFETIDPTCISDNFIDAIANQWMLVTAGTADDCNTMTASWGGVGELWGGHVAFVFIRPQRHTHIYTEREERMTLSFFDRRYRQALAYCGSHSGRNEPKIANAGLSVTTTDDGVPAIAQARLILQCRKLYADTIRPEAFVDPSFCEKMYPEKDFHTVYVVRIEKAYIANQ